MVLTLGSSDVKKMKIKEDIRVNVIDSYKGLLFTQSEEVNSKTDLKTLNLNWAEKDLPEKKRTKHVHRLHPYLGKYIPQLVEVFLRRFFNPGDRILDPFVGSGTTLVQANELGINSVGIDISEFNVLLSKVKTDSYDINLLKKEVYDILEKVYKQTDNIQGTLFEKEYSQKATNNEYLNKWFHKNALHELIVFKSMIKDYHYQNVLKVIMSRAARSARQTTHHELDFPKQPQTEPYYCRKHSRMCQPTKEAFKFLKRYGFDTLRRIEEFSKLKTNAKVDIIHGDSRIVEFGQINGVITSPPYVGNIDYHEQHRYAYELLELESRDAEEIGPAFKGQTNGAKKDYVQKIQEVFVNIKQHMRDDGYIIIVANDKWELYNEIRESADLKEEAKIFRHVNRRTGRRTKPYYETVFIWKK